MVVACVVLARAETPWPELDGHLKASTLAHFKRPRAYMRLDALPRNAANKVLRRELREAAIKAREGRDANFLQL